MYGLQPVEKQNCDLVIEMATIAGKKLRFMGLLFGAVLHHFDISAAKLQKISKTSKNIEQKVTFCHLAEKQYLCRRNEKTRGLYGAGGLDERVFERAAGRAV